MWFSQKLILGTLFIADFKLVFIKWEGSTVDYYFQVNVFPVKSKQNIVLKYSLVNYTFLSWLCHWGSSLLRVKVNSPPYLYPLMFHVAWVASFCKRCLYLRQWLQNIWAWSTNSSTFMSLFYIYLGNTWDVGSKFSVLYRYPLTLLKLEQIWQRQLRRTLRLLFQIKAQWLNLKVFIREDIAGDFK